MTLRLLLPIALALLAIPLAAASGVATLDGDTPLTHDRTIEEWEKTENVTVQPAQLDLRITIAADASTVGLDDLKTVSTTNYFLRFDYDEDIARTVRFYVPDDYWTPYPSGSVDVKSGDADARFEPTVAGNNTAVTVDADGPTDVVMVVNRRSAWTFAARDRSKSLVENVTGVDVPSVGASRQWEYLSDSDFGNETRAAIDSDGRPVTVQFDAESGNGTRWENARECSDDGRRVCTFAVDDDEMTYVLSRSADPPRVRYKIDGGLTDRIGGAWNELVGIVRGDDPEPSEHDSDGWIPWF